MPEIEFGRVTQSRQLKRLGILSANQKLTPVQLIGFLAGAIGNLNRVVRCLIIKHGNDQSRTRLGAGLDAPVIGEMTPDNFTCFRDRPPTGRHA